MKNNTRKALYSIVDLFDGWLEEAMMSGDPFEAEILNKHSNQLREKYNALVNAMEKDGFIEVPIHEDG